MNWATAAAWKGRCPGSGEARSDRNPAAPQSHGTAREVAASGAVVDSDPAVVVLDVVGPDAADLAAHSRDRAAADKAVQDAPVRAVAEFAADSNPAAVAEGNWVAVRMKLPDPG